MKLASYLIQRGARIVFDNEKDLESPIRAAVRHGHLKILELLLWRGGVEAMQPGLETALRLLHTDWQFDAPKVQILLDYSPHF